MYFLCLILCCIYFKFPSQLHDEGDFEITLEELKDGYCDEVDAPPALIWNGTEWVSRSLYAKNDIFEDHGPEKENLSNLRILKCNQQEDNRSKIHSLLLYSFPFFHMMASLTVI